MKKNKIVAVIAARSGSLRVKNKNIRDFYNTTLLEIKIKQLQRIKEIDDVIVNSNCDEILNIAEECGATIVKRDDVHASNSANMSDVFANIAENVDSEYILYANCTNPLVKDTSVEKVIKLFFENLDNLKDFDSLTSCHEVKEFLYLDNKALNYDPLNQPRSQDLPNIIALNFALSIISKKDMIKYRNILGKKPYFFVLNEEESVDIDSPQDFFIAEKLYEDSINNNGLI